LVQIRERDNKKGKAGEPAKELNSEKRLSDSKEEESQKGTRRGDLQEDPKKKRNTRRPSSGNGKNL